MAIVFPIRFDDPVEFQGNSINGIDVSSLAISGTFSDEGESVTVNGYDSSPENSGRGVRLTNLAGVANGVLLKRCPKCGAVKTVQEFDPHRTTNERRDQSNCTDCRSQY